MLRFHNVLSGDSVFPPHTALHTRKSDRSGTNGLVIASQLKIVAELPFPPRVCLILGEFLTQPTSACLQGHPPTAKAVKPLGKLK
jgi:hypothetical protein